MLAAQVHLGTKQCDFQMERYVYRRRQDGIFVINLGKTWEKLQLAARVIVAIENPQDVVVQSARPYAQRAVLKFAQYTGAKALAGRYTPGMMLCSQYRIEPPCMPVCHTTSMTCPHEPFCYAIAAQIHLLPACEVMHQGDDCMPCCGM